PATWSEEILKRLGEYASHACYSLDHISGPIPLRPVSYSFRCERHFRQCLVQNDALDRIEVSLPRGLLKGSHCCGVASGAACTDAGRAEIYVLGMIFITYAWG